MPRQTSPKTKPPKRPAPAPAPASPASTPAPTAASSLPIHHFPSMAGWESWLETNHTTTVTGIWLKISKKGSALASVTYDEAVDTALCFGWIDGQRKGHDDGLHFLQRFTPRRRSSIWSKRNVDKVAALAEAGRMRRAGRDEVDAAKADGRWERAYAGSATIVVPQDLETALAGEARARAFFDGLSRSKRYAFLWRIETAKKAETRRKRVEEAVALLKTQKTL
ncbi:bacteriocin-protection, YdeI or OmpD-associated-domain-containing protein [Lasiosphaeris hirsuta]|uniref:Bacteriocin-protection, YdeI or OmpD-associated-domain-containing protein n=1 Tax=Lasiosphaeris hirsuta TaxID=260670 RepID=A0AA40DSR5_9PEZI|nr:bacteriocin-protection, YdeI or OmpD-associated-domain-containing protein [Lasiosphaeris hirsuta]